MTTDQAATAAELARIRSVARFVGDSVGGGRDINLLLDEIDRLHAALVEERAHDCLRRLYLNGEVGSDLWYYDTTEAERERARTQARAELIAAGTLPH